VIAKAVASTNIALSSTGVDAGTGDVTFNLTTTGVDAGTGIKLTFDIYGRITGSSGLSSSDIPSGSAHYIQNQSASPQAACSFNISGSGQLGAGLILSSAAPGVTANTLYNVSGTLMWAAMNVVTATFGSLSDGQVLTWDNTAGYWKNAILPVATDTVAGVIKVGTSLSIAAGVLNINATIPSLTTFTNGIQDGTVTQNRLIYGGASGRLTSLAGYQVDAGWLNGVFASSSNSVFGASVTGDTVARFLATAGGVLSFSSGSTAADILVQRKVVASLTSLSISGVILGEASGTIQARMYANVSSGTSIVGINLAANNSSAQVVDYARFAASIQTNGAGTHDGRLILAAAKAGALTDYVNVGVGSSYDGFNLLSGSHYVNGTLIVDSQANATFTKLVTTAGEITNTSNENYRILLHCDGVNGSRRFVDSGSYGYQVATWGTNYYTSATHSTTQSKFGGSSLLLNGSTWLEVFSRFSIGTGDFTVDFHAYFTSVSGTQTLFDWGGSAAGVTLVYSSGTWTLTVAGTACTFSNTPSVNTWYHIAMSRTSNSVRFFIAGTKTGTTQTASGSVTATNTSSLLIGANTSLANLTSAYVDEFRFLTALSAYTSDSNITVPTTTYAPHGFKFAKTSNITLQSGSVLTIDANGLATPQRPSIVREITYVLGESVVNSNKYFYVARGLGNTQDDAQRSGNASGMSYQNACSPEIAPCNGRIVRAILKLQGAGTNTGTVTYPVAYRCDLYRVGWAAEHDPNINGGSPVTINFSLTSGVGTYSVGATNATAVIYNPDIPINIGDALALKFIANAGNSTVAISQLAAVTLVIEETF
jgi:hypothetical protein